MDKVVATQTCGLVARLETIDLRASWLARLADGNVLAKDLA